MGAGNEETRSQEQCGVERKELKLRKQWRIRIGDERKVLGRPGAVDRAGERPCMVN